MEKQELIYKGIKELVLSEEVVYHIYDVTDIKINLPAKKIMKPCIAYLYTADEGTVDIDIVGIDIDMSGAQNGKKYKIVASGDNVVDVEELDKLDNGSNDDMFNPYPVKSSGYIYQDDAFIAERKKIVQFINEDLGFSIKLEDFDLYSSDTINGNWVFRIIPQQTATHNSVTFVDPLVFEGDEVPIMEYGFVYEFNVLGKYASWTVFPNPNINNNNNL